MRAILAERLLARVLNWSAEDVDRERPDLQALANLKYDHYQQFSPGMRFIESLAVWLGQFHSLEERQIAYKFVRSRLVFISEAEIAHLIAIAFPDIIRPILITHAAKSLGVPRYLVNKITNSSEYRCLLRQSLFVGLSDGARIGAFRRSNPQISNEQIRLSYEIPSERVEDLIEDLRSDLEKILNRNPYDSECRFSTVFLLDDFSASGLSYIRMKSQKTYSGKIVKIFSSLFDKKGALSALVNPKRTYVAIVLYSATSRALHHLRQLIDTWIKDNKVQFNYSINAIQEIPSNVCVQPDSDDQFIKLLEKYHDPSIQDKHYKVGTHTKPYLGFSECALPVILGHNTPNNSVPLLWYDENKTFRGLFPRVSRHKQV